MASQEQEVEHDGQAQRHLAQSRQFRPEALVAGNQESVQEKRAVHRVGVPIVIERMGDVGEVRKDKIEPGQQRQDRNKHQPGATELLEAFPDSLSSTVHETRDGYEQHCVEEQIEEVPEMVPCPVNLFLTRPCLAREILESQVLSHEAQEAGLNEAFVQRFVVALRRDDKCHTKQEGNQQSPDAA